MKYMKILLISLSIYAIGGGAHADQLEQIDPQSGEVVCPSGQGAGCLPCFMTFGDDGQNQPMPMMMFSMMSNMFQMMAAGQSQFVQQFCKIG